MTMITGRISPLPTVSQLGLSSALFGMRVSLRGKRSEWARLAWTANTLTGTTSIKGLRADEGCGLSDVGLGVLETRLEQGGFTAIDGTILPRDGQHGDVYAAYGLNSEKLNPSPRTTKYRCWSLREGLDSRK